MLRNAAPEGLWLRADAQDSGRGRLGRQWMSEPGNVFASTIVRLRPADPASSTLAFVAGLAAHETLRQIAPEIAIQTQMAQRYFDRGWCEIVRNLA